MMMALVDLDRFNDAAATDRALKNVLKVADGLARKRNGVAGLLALGRLVGRHLVYDYMMRELATHNAPDNALEDWRALARYYGLEAEYREPEQTGGEPVRLALDPVITRPWAPERLIDNLNNLARGPAGEWGAWGPWRHVWHDVTLWLPMRLAEVVANGMHSVTVGQLCNDGTVLADTVYDLSSIFDKVRRPRRRWLDRESGEEIADVSDWRLVAMFEIGRRLHRLGCDGRLAPHPK
jgi:hypothetical protein